MSKKRCCVTLDLENNWAPSDPALDYETFEHLPQFIETVQELGIPLSVFVVGNALEDRPEAVETLRSTLDVEFHLHSYAHDLTGSIEFEDDLRRGLDAYEDFFGRSPIGYRAPMGRISSSDLSTLEDSGFAFDSSVFPTIRPGVFNNLRSPLTPHVPAQCTSLIEVPIGCLRYIRIPLVHSYLKLLGRPSRWAVGHAPLPDVVTFVVHLQDLFHTTMHDRLDQPLRIVHNRNLDTSLSLFGTVLNALDRRGYEFVGTTDIVDAFRGERSGRPTH